MVVGWAVGEIVAVGWAAVVMGWVAVGWEVVGRVAKVAAAWVVVAMMVAAGSVAWAKVAVVAVMREVVGQERERVARVAVVAMEVGVDQVVKAVQHSAQTTISAGQDALPALLCQGQCCTVQGTVRASRLVKAVLILGISCLLAACTHVSSQQAHAKQQVRQQA